MKLPRLYSSSNRTRKAIGTFGGLNQRIVVQENEFSDMTNMSCVDFPVIRTRDKRGEILHTYANPQGLLWKNGLFVVDDGKCFYKGDQVFEVTDGEKQLVGMGAYICVFPDKLIFNTYTGEVEPMEAEYLPSDTVTFAPLSEDSTFTKITASSIGRLFHAYDNVTIDKCYDSQFNGTKIITEAGDDYIVVSGVLDSSFTQDPSSGLNFTRKVPDMDFVCESNNRLWGCSSANHEIYACKLGDPKNWNNFEGIDSDAYVSTVGSDGDFTGCIAHLGYVLFFKENRIHTMYGDKPSNFSLYDKELPGVKEGCDKSLVIINDVLYYVGTNGVYAYSGSMPQKITENILEPISEAVGGRNNARYYLSCKLSDKQRILVYDPLYGVWDAEDDDVFQYASSSSGELLYIDADGHLRSIVGNADEVIEWELVSGDLLEGMLEYKYISQLCLNVWLNNACLNCYVKYDDEEHWERLVTIQCDEHRTYSVPILPKRCSKFKWRIEGQGEMKLVGVQQIVEGGSELNGNVYSGLRRQHQ